MAKINPSLIPELTTINQQTGASALANFTDGDINKNGWNVNLDNAYAKVNQPTVVYGPSWATGWFQVPTDLGQGVRYVHFLEPSKVVLIIYGVDTNLTPGIWMCRYGWNDSWSNWSRVA